MPGMYKGLVCSPQLEDVSCHQQECIGYLLQGHCQAAGAEPFGNGNEQCDSEQHQEQPPLQPPCPAINRKQHGEEEREAHQQQAGNGKLLEKLVAEVPVTRNKRLPQKLGESLAVVPLCADGRNRRCSVSSHRTQRFRADNKNACRDRAGSAPIHGRNRPQP